MRAVVTLSLFLFITISFAQTTDTRVIIPGVTLTRFSMPGPYVINVVQFDLHNPFLHLETFWTGTLAPTSVQAAANDSDGHRVVAAVNGDLFENSGWPTDNAVIGGRIVLGKQVNRSHLALTEDSRPTIDRYSFSGKCIADSGKILDVSAVNTWLGSGNTVLFNSYFGNSTGTDNTGIEFSLAPLFTTWHTNDTLSFVVQDKQTAGNMAIPPDGLVLSAGGGASATAASNSLSVGDTVKLYVGFTPVIAKKILYLVGGAGQLVKNGTNVAVDMAHTEGLITPFYSNRYARTVAGFNANASTLYLCAVDLNGSSIGMTFDEMANFLLSIGVSDAVNLDGGPSTTMVVNDTVVSNPGSGFERSVANTLQLICTARTDSLTVLSLREKNVNIVHGDTLHFHAKGINYFLDSISVLPTLHWSTDTSIGVIDGSGNFIAGTTNGSGWVRIQYGSLRDSAKVHVIDAPAGVSGKPDHIIQKFFLEQNFPNPFNPSTVIGYQLPASGVVIIRIFDVLGREAAVLVNEVQHAGTHSVQWNAAGMPSGIYFCRLTVSEKNGMQYRDTKRLVLMK